MTIQLYRVLTGCIAPMHLFHSVFAMQLLTDSV